MCLLIYVSPVITLDKKVYLNADKAVHAILDAGILCHVAYVIDGQPYCTPTIHWRDGDMLYNAFGVFHRYSRFAVA